MEDLELLEARFHRLKARDELHDEVAARRCCLLALQALREGSYGVGAVLLDEQSNIIAEGYNRVFSDGFHSARHAEMEALDDFELSCPYTADRSTLRLVVSLEPCPMCFSRLLFSGIGEVRFLVADPDGGMATRCGHLPPTWRNLALLQSQRVAHCSEGLKRLAADLARANLPELRRQLMQHIRG